MGKAPRKILAVNATTGERREFANSYECAAALGTTHMNVLFALNRGGSCRGWRMYDTPDNLRKRIAELQRQLAEMEGTE